MRGVCESEPHLNQSRDLSRLAVDRKGADTCEV